MPPVESQKQRSFLNWKFGHNWVRKHHFDQKGKLPEYVDKPTYSRWPRKLKKPI